MKTSNRIITLILSFILSACSIPNILANTNPENTTVDLSSLPAPTSTPPAPDDVVAPPAANPPDLLQKDLTRLATLSTELVDSMTSGVLILPQQDVLKQELNETKIFATQLLKDIQDNAPDMKMQVLCELIINSQIERIISIVEGKKLSPPNLDDAVNLVQQRDQTIDDLQKAVAATDQKFQDLNATIVKKNKSKIDRTNDQALKQLCIVDMILEELAQYINNQSIQVPDKTAAIDAITHIRRVIEPCKSDRTQVDEQRIHSLLTLNKHLMEHISTIVKNNFKNIPTLDVNSLFNKDKKDISLEELNQDYQENEKLLESLRKTSQDAGLRWYNHGARKITSAWNYLDAGNRLPYLAFAAAAASVYAHQTGILPEWVKNAKIPFTNIKIYGETALRQAVMDANDKPILRKGGSTILSELTNASSMGIVAHAYDFFEQSFMKNPVFEIPAMMALGGAATDYDRFRGWSGEYLTKLSNFVLGKKAGKSNTQMTRLELDSTLDDMIGQQEIKDTLAKIVRYIEDPQSIDNRGLKLEKGYLFTGETRSGKTHAAKCLGGEIKRMLKRNGKNEDSFNFFVIPTEILRQPGKFRQCLREARAFEPCILFIDECHLLELQAGKNNPILSEFLTELSGCMTDPESKVFVIAATNHADNLDKALRQSGRFGKEIHFEYPTFNDRKTFIIDILEKRSVNTTTLDINKFAYEAEGSTYEDIKKTIEDAFITAKFNLETLSQKHLDDSFDRNIRQIIFNHDRKPSDQERSIIAIQQAGYVLATKLLAPREIVAKVTTLPIREPIKEKSIMSQYTTIEESKGNRIIHGKMFTYKINNNKTLKTLQEQINACAIASSGYAAGNILLGKANNSAAYAETSLNEAFTIAKSVVANGANIEGDHLKNDYEKRAVTFRNACEKKATDLMAQNKEALEALAGALFEYGTLTGREVDAILSQCKLSIPPQDDAILDSIDSATK